MALTKAQKTDQLNELKKKMQDSKSIMFAHYIGMKVADSSDFRTKLREKQSEMKVAKKTLMQIAAKELNMPEISDELLDGPVACIFSYDDALSGAQIAFKFSKEHPQVELIGGIYEGKVLSKAETIAIAKIPGKQQLLGMFAAMINSPLSSFARGLSELAKQKEAPAPVVEAKSETVIASPSSDPAAAEPVTEAMPAPEAATEAAPTPATTEEAPAASAAEAPPAA